MTRWSTSLTPVNIIRIFIFTLILYHSNNYQNHTINIVRLIVSNSWAMGINVEKLVIDNIDWEFWLLVSECWKDGGEAHPKTQLVQAKFFIFWSHKDLHTVSWHSVIVFALTFITTKVITIIILIILDIFWGFCVGLFLSTLIYLRLII